MNNFVSFPAIERKGLIIKTSCLGDQTLMFFFDSKTNGFSLKVFMNEAAAASFLRSMVDNGILDKS